MQTAPTLSTKTYRGAGVPDPRLQFSALLQQTFNGGGWLFLDSWQAGRFSNEVRRIVVRLGRSSEVEVVDFYDSNSKTLGVLSGNAANDAWTLSSLLPPDHSPEGYIHKQLGNLHLTMLIEAMQVTGQPVSVKALAELLQSAPALQELYSKVPADSRVRVALGTRLDAATPGAVVGASPEQLLKELAAWVGPIIQVSTSNPGRIFGAAAPDIDLVDVVRNSKMVYVMLPRDAQASAAMARMISSALRATITQLEDYPEQDPSPRPFMQFDWVQAVA